MPRMPLTPAERAYRHGAKQALAFILSGIDSRWSDGQLVSYLSEWHLRLHAAQGDEDMKYLGKYLDEVHSEVMVCVGGAGPLKK